MVRIWTTMSKLQIIIHCFAIAACIIVIVAGDQEPNTDEEVYSDPAAGGPTDHYDEQVVTNEGQVESPEEIVAGNDYLNATGEGNATSNNEPDHDTLITEVVSSNNPTSKDEITTTTSIEDAGVVNNNDPNLAAGSTEINYDETSAEQYDDLKSTEAVTTNSSEDDCSEVTIGPTLNYEDVPSKNEMNYGEINVATEDNLNTNYSDAGLVGSTDLNGTNLNGTNLNGTKLEASNRTDPNVTYDVDTSSFMDCCDGKQYNPRSDICCHSKIYKLPETYNFQSRWKCCGKVMYDSDINFCCDSNSDHILPKVDLAPDTGCCGPMNYNRTNDVCCIESHKNDFRYSYYVLHDVPDLSVFCCGSYTYTQGICCSGRLYRKEEYLQVCAEDDCICCGTSIASRSTQICCNYHLYPRYSQDDQCCGSVKFNSFDGTSMCCQGNLYQGYHRDSAACCGKQIYLVQQQDCCNEKLTEKNRTRVLNECCGTTNPRDPPKDMHISKEPPKGSEISVQYFKIKDPENQDVELRFFD